jgi:hypothetical protein
MDCPKCKTWNPDDKLICWRCQAELPKPVEKKKKRTPTIFLGLPIWAWIMLAAMVLIWVFAQSLMPR